MTGKKPTTAMGAVMQCGAERARYERGSVRGEPVGLGAGNRAQPRRSEGTTAFNAIARSVAPLLVADLELMGQTRRGEGTGGRETRPVRRGPDVNPSLPCPNLPSRALASAQTQQDGTALSLPVSLGPIVPRLTLSFASEVVRG